MPEADTSRWERVYKEIQNSPDEFARWTELVEEAERLEGGLHKFSSPRALQLFRFSYDGFLERFPFLHGYWIRYAETLFRLGLTEDAADVYLRGTCAIPGSVELWAKYCAFVALTEGDSERVRALFEQGSRHIGVHFLSHEFWDAYLDFEEREGQTQRVYDLLSRIARIPLHQYAKFFDRLRKMAAELPVHQTAPPEYLEQFQAEYDLEMEEGGDAVSTPPTGPAGPQGSSSANGFTTAARKAAEERDLRSRVDSYLTGIYLQTQAEVAKRLRNESAIGRQYYHVAFLPEAERVNWRQYLDSEEVEGDGARIRMLYERAVIPTANEEEFWMRYARWNIARRRFEDARAILARACLVVPIGRTQLRHYYAALEMSLGHTATARAIYESVLEALPSSVETLCLLSALIANNDGVPAAIDRVRQELKVEGRPPLEKLALVDELERLYFCQNDIEAIRALYESVATEFDNFFPFWRKYLRFEIERPAPTVDGNDAAVRQRHEAVARVHNRIQGSSLDPADKRDLAHTYMVFLLTHCSASDLNEYSELDRSFHRSVVAPVLV